MSDVENTNGNDDVDTDDILQLRKMFEAAQGRPTTLDDDDIQDVLNVGEEEWTEEQWVAAMLSAEEGNGDNDGEGEDDDDAKAAAAVAASNRINFKRAETSVAAIDKHPELSEQLEDYANVQLTSKIKVLFVYDALVKAVPEQELLSWPEPMTVAEGMEGKVSANNPDRYKRYGAGGRIVTRSFFEDEVHDRMAGSADLMKAIDTAQAKYDGLKESGKSGMDDAQMELNTLQDHRKARVKALRRAYTIWLQMRRAKEYSGVSVIEKRRVVKSNDGKTTRREWRRVQKPIELQSDAERSTYILLTPSQFERLNFQKAEAICAEHRRKKEDHDPYEILLNTRRRPRKDLSEPVEVNDKNAIGILTGLSLWSDLDKADDLIWRTIGRSNEQAGTKAERDVARHVEAQIVRLHDNLSVYVQAIKGREKRKQMAKQAELAAAKAKVQAAANG